MTTAGLWFRQVCKKSFVNVESRRRSTVKVTRRVVSIGTEMNSNGRIRQCIPILLELLISPTLHQLKGSRAYQLDAAAVLLGRILERNVAAHIDTGVVCPGCSETGGARDTGAVRRGAHSLHASEECDVA